MSRRSTKRCRDRWTPRQAGQTAAGGRDAVLDAVALLATLTRDEKLAVARTLILSQLDVSRGETVEMPSCGGVVIATMDAKLAMRVIQLVASHAREEPDRVSASRRRAEWPVQAGLAVA